jgi:hypothetical protein
MPVYAGAIQGFAPGKANDKEKTKKGAFLGCTTKK